LFESLLEAEFDPLFEFVPEPEEAPEEPPLFELPPEDELTAVPSTPKAFW